MSSSSSKAKPVVLIDVDGVLADFTGPILKHANRLTGNTYTEQDIEQYEIGALYPELEFQELYEPCVRQGFCLGLESLPGADEALIELRKRVELIAVTSPWWSSPYWHHERTRWLMARGFRPEQICFTARKELVRGAALIDDKTSHVLDWAHKNPSSLPILWKQPWSQSTDDYYTGIRAIRAGQWEHLLDLITRRSEQGAL